MNKTLKNIDLVQLCITVVINVLIWIALTTCHNSSLLNPHQTTDKEFESPSLMRMVRSAAPANRIYDGPHDANGYRNEGNGNGNGIGNTENVNKYGNSWNGNNGNENKNDNGSENGNDSGNNNGADNGNNNGAENGNNNGADNENNNGADNGNDNGNHNGNNNGNNEGNGASNVGDDSGNGNNGREENVRSYSAYANIPKLYNTFILWGVTSCPGNALHMGTSTTGSAVVAGSKYLASDMMCLPDNAGTRDDVVNLDNKTASTTYPVYRPLNRNPSQYAPLKCAFCSDSVNHVRTIIGTTFCPSKWEKYYSGYLMTKGGKHGLYMTGNYCVKSTVVSRGESQELMGFKLSYILLDNKPISCAVCAK